jgi:AsmA protein
LLALWLALNPISLIMGSMSAIARFQQLASVRQTVSLFLHAVDFINWYFCQLLSAYVGLTVGRVDYDSIGGTMAARPLPSPEPPRSQRKTEPVATAATPQKQPFFEMFLKNLHAITKKRWLRVAGIVVAAFFVLLLALPFLINVNSFRPKIESEATNALGRQVKLGNLSLSILSGTVGIEDISIADDPAFSKSSFITAKSLKVGVEMMPLIFSKQVRVTGIALNEPQITLLKAANGTWNFSSLGGAGAKKTPESNAPAASNAQGFSVAKVEIKDGKLIVGKANSATKPQLYDKVNLEVKNFSYASQFPIKLTVVLPGGGTASVSGKAGPINAQDAAKTPLETTVKVGTPAPKTITVKHSVNVDLEKQSGTITQGDIAIGSAQAHLTGSFQAQGETKVVNFRLNAPSMSVDELEAMLPSMGIVLPSGSQLKGGTLSVEVAIAGPLDKLVITGPVRLSNSELTNFDLGSKLGALSTFAGKSVSNPNTLIQNASLNARVAPEGTKADNINLNVPTIGVITGAGTVSPSGDLAFKMLADLHGGMVAVEGRGNNQRQGWHSLCHRRNDLESEIYCRHGRNGWGPGHESTKQCCQGTGSRS